MVMRDLRNVKSGVQVTVQAPRSNSSTGESDGFLNRRLGVQVLLGTLAEG